MFERIILTLVGLAFAGIGVGPAMAGRTADFAAVCEQAAEIAAQKTGVPVSVLKAISLNETGRKSGGAFRPWAWTVNMEGKGFWFDTLDEARTFVFKEFKRGARSFDVGCFQINYKWHGQAFSSIDAMFDPLENGLYAARFLKDLYNETGSWSKAAGAYHSRTPKYADKYAARFTKFRQKFLQEDGSGKLRVAYAEVNEAIPDIPDIVAAAQRPVAVPAKPRINTFPLFIRKEGQAARMGGAAGASLFASALEKSQVQ